MAELVESVILASDASYDHETKLAGYAFCIKTPHKPLLQQAGVAKRAARSSTEAELIALANALYVLRSVEKPKRFKLFVYMDNEAAILHADPEYEATSKGPRKFQRNNEDIVTYCRNELRKYAPLFEIRHVKAHTSSLKVSWNQEHHMNHWCDLASRDEMRKAKVAQALQKY